MSEVVLALDTSTESCSVALFFQGHIVSRAALEPRQHVNLLLGMIDECLAEAGIEFNDCTALAFGTGPGSFTGVRIAASCIQGLAVAGDIPVIGISSLQALAQQAWRREHAEHIVAALDARKHEVYWACYCVEKGLAQALGDDMLSAPDAVTLSDECVWTAIGPGFVEYPQLVQASMRVLAGYPLAEDIITLALPKLAAGEGVPAAQAQPLYLRNDITD